MADGKTFTLEIITPDRIFYTGSASMLEVTTSEGEIGVYANHVPMTNILMPGVAKITIPGEAEKKVAAIHSGFVEILPERVVIMAEVAEWPDEIDANRAKEAEIRAQRRLSMKAAGTDIGRAELALKRALVRLSVSK